MAYQMKNHAIETLANGAFRSIVRGPAGSKEDGNGFITATVCELLRTPYPDPAMVKNREHAVDFLEQCACVYRDGHYTFYAAAEHPSWMAQGLHSDVNSTALISVVLHAYGRLSQADLKHCVKCAVQPNVITHLNPHCDPWLLKGVVETWTDPLAFKCPVDLITNINILVLLQKADMLSVEADAIMHMLSRALIWAGASKENMRKLSPWYPEPIELLWALERAQRLGVKGLAGFIKRLRGLNWVQSDLKATASLAVYGYKGGRFQWTSSVLDQARHASNELAMT